MRYRICRERAEKSGFLLLCLVLIVGCGSPDEGGIEGPSVDSGAGADVTIEEDAGVAEDTGPEDAGPEDTGPEDTGPQDTGPEDTGPEDTGPVDTGPVDAGPVDTGPKPPTQDEICKGYSDQFSAVAAAAKKCATPYSCTDLAAAGMGCKSCETFYSHDDASKVQAVHDVSSESTQKKCQPACPKQCIDPDKHVGVCKDGGCTFDAPSCQEIEKRFKTVVTQAMKCSEDAECKFQAQASLPCGCGAFMNIKTMGPNKPLFRYAKMLVTVYNAQKCFTGACACPSYSKATCDNGVCVSKE